MTKKVVIIDHNPSRGEAIKGNLSRVDNFTPYYISWTRSGPDSGPDINVRTCINQLSNADVVLLHGSEREWFELFVRAFEPLEDTKENPILWHYRGSPHGKKLTTEDFREGVNQVHDWGKIASRFDLISPITEDIDNGEEIDWEVLLRDRSVQLRSLDYTIFLCILCQGYLCVHKYAGYENGPDYEKALDAIGWKYIDGSAVVQKLENKRSNVRNSLWWKRALDLDEPELKNHISKELKEDIPGSDSKVSRLLSEIYNSESIDDVGLVSSALLEILEHKK